MPITYGHPNEITPNISNDLEQYTKWFNLMNMDFELSHIGNSWICKAWSRNKDSLVQSSSGTKPTIDEALHQCYSDIKALLSL